MKHSTGSPIQGSVKRGLVKAKKKVFRAMFHLQRKLFHYLEPDPYKVLSNVEAVHLDEPAAGKSSADNVNAFLSRDPFADINLQELCRDTGLTSLDLLRIPRIRHKIALQRWERFNRNGKFISADFSKKDMLPETYDYSLMMVEKSLGVLGFLERPILLLNPLLAVDKVRHSVSSCKILSIGPRTEYEILLMLSYGFSLANITALDLFTYSPWIETGDMHDMKYLDNAFDVVFLGDVFPYSTNIPKLAEEIIRVCKPGGCVAISTDYVPPSERSVPRQLSRPPNWVWFERSQQLLDYFSGHVDNVFFRQDGQLLDSAQSNVRVVFDIKK